MESYNFDFNAIMNETSKDNKKQLDQLNIIMQFGIANKRAMIDSNLLKHLGEDQFEKTGILVPMDYYCLMTGEDNAFTVGMVSCCGLVIFNENNKFIMHMSPLHTTNDILVLLNSLNLLSHGEVFIFPGNACEFEEYGNQINYNQLAKRLESLNNSVYVRKFNSMSGSVYLLGEKLVIVDDQLLEIKDFRNSIEIKK